MVGAIHIHKETVMCVGVGWGALHTLTGCQPVAREDNTDRLRHLCYISNRHGDGEGEDGLNKLNVKVDCDTALLQCDVAGGELKHWN